MQKKAFTLGWCGWCAGTWWRRLARGRGSAAPLSSVSGVASASEPSDEASRAPLRPPPKSHHITLNNIFYAADIKSSFRELHKPKARNISPISFPNG